MALVDRPCLASINKVGEHYRFVGFNLCLRGSTSPDPQILGESAEGSTCFGESGVELAVDEYCATKTRELAHCVEPLSADGDGLNVELLGAGLCITAIFLVLFVSPKLSQASGDLSVLCCISASETALRFQSSTKRKSLMVFDETLVLPAAFCLLRLKSDPNICVPDTYAYSL